MSNSTTVKKASGRPVDPNSKFLQAQRLMQNLLLQDANATRETILNEMVAQLNVKLSSAKVFYSQVKNPPNKDPNRVIVKRNRRRKEAGDQTGVSGEDSSGVNIDTSDDSTETVVSDGFVDTVAE